MANTSQNKTPEQTKKDLTNLTNTYMSRLLGYIRDDNIAFSEFIKQFDKYVNESGAVIAYTCDSHNKPTQDIDTGTDLVYLERLINKLGISLDYFPQDYNSSEDEKNEKLKQLYLTAIRGAVINRTGSATKTSITEALETMYPEAQIVITDGGVPNSNVGAGVMNVYIYVKGQSSTIDDAVLSLYLKQNITGVQEVFEFDVDGTGIFAPIDPAIIDDIENEKDRTAVAVFRDGYEPQTAEQLTTFFNKYKDNTDTNLEQYVRPYNYNAELSPTGKGGYMFMNYDNNLTALNKEVEITNNEEKYLNTGFWLISLI